MNGTSTVLSGIFAGRYLIERELGRGGTAIVYLARDQQRGHAVAIKILRPEFAESIGAERFLKEIRLTQQLHHPQIVPVLDSGKHDGQLYFVLPHMEGGTLRDRLHRDKQLTLEEVVAITQAISNALAHAHEKGLVHRDVKPENILFTSGQACLSDFGIARALESAMGESTTSTSVVRGTPPYMSPEQASGEKSLDGRSDIYSFGCVVYEMLAGMQPFVGPTPQSVIAQRLIHPPRPIRMYRPGLPTAVEIVLKRALAVSRADRFQKATDFADALDAASRTTDDVTIPDDVTPRRRRRFAIAATVAAVAIAAAIVVTNWLGGLDIFNRDQGPGPAANANRIAVRYFEAPAADSQLVAVAGGLTRDLIDALRRVQALTLISSEGVRQFAPSVPIDSVARVLNVGTVVTGTLERRGDSISVDVRLVDGGTLVDFGNARVVYPAAMVVHLRDSVVQQVAAQLRRQIGPRVQLQEWRAGTRSRRAWELRQRAQQLSEYERDLPRRAADFGPQLSVLVTAESLLVTAGREDPAWQEPLIERGWLQLRRSGYVDAVWEAALLDSAARTGQRALARRPGDAGALELLGFAQFGRWRSTSVRVRPPGLLDSAEANLRAATIADRHFARAWLALSNLLDFKGDTAGAADAARRALAEDAFLSGAGRATMRLVFRYLYDRKYDSARSVCGRARAQFPVDGYVQSCELSVLGWSGSGPRDVADVWAALDRTERTGIFPLVGGVFPAGRYFAAAVLARSGLTDSARAVMTATRDRLRKAGYTEETAINEAQVLVLLGMRDSAMVTLERAVTRDSTFRTIVARYPWFDPLRTHPQYPRLMGAR